MPPNPYATVLELLAIVGTSAVVASGVVVFFLKAYFSGYLGEKAKNLATKEDIAEITRQVEGVKNEYSLNIEGLKAHNQLKMAALAERLQAQQQAFMHWRRLNRAAHTRDDAKLMIEVLACEAWWDENCLYLNAETREAFQESYWSAKYFFSASRATMQPQMEINAWDRLNAAGDVIVRSVDLPSLGRREHEYIGGGKSDA